MVFHYQLVRSSSGCYPTFNLPMDSSPGFGSTTTDSRPLQTRFPFGFASYGLTSPATITRRLINQKARGHPFGLPLLVGTRFQVLFHSPPGVLFTFPSRYCSTIGQQGVFSLGGWSPLIHAGFLVPRATRDHCPEPFTPFAYGAFTLSGRPSQTFRLDATVPRRICGYAQLCPSTPHQQHPQAITLVRFRLFPFRSPLLRESLLISLPPVTEMFHFTGFASLPRCLASLPDGFSHSGIRGSTVACTFPRLFAACHALLRLLLPRHPPCALCTFTFSYALFNDLRTLTHWWRQGDSNP